MEHHKGKNHMATRLKTRLSAGAALVTGLGMIGLATAVPAQAAATMQYSCTTPLGPQVLDVTLDTDAPGTATTEDELTIKPSGTVTLNANISNAMVGALKWDDVSASIPGVTATISNGTDSADITTDLSIPRTTIGDSGSFIDGNSTPELPISGTAQTTTIAAPGTYTVSAPSTFNATFNGFDAAGQTGDLSPIASVCTYVAGSGSQVIDTVTVTDAPEPTDPTTSEPTTSEPTTSEPTTSEPTTSEPTTTGPTTSEPTTDEPTVEANDWFTEPNSLPITEDGKHFTVKGTSDIDGTVDVVLLDKDKKVLRTISWDVTQGTNTKNFPFAEGTDYVRIISQDCVDAQGNDGSVAGGCNVEYYAPWVNPDSSTSDGTDGDDEGTDGPETPGVVQTDGFTRVEQPAGNNNAALLLGGALLAGAGAGTVLLARRRQGAQH